MSDTRGKLAAAIREASDAHIWQPHDARCSCGEVPPVKAGFHTVDQHERTAVADALLASDVLRDMLAEAEARGRAEVTAAVEVVLGDMEDTATYWQAAYREKRTLDIPGRVVADHARDLRHALADRGALDRVRAEAWDEGHQAAYLFERGEIYPEPRNPYRIERDGGA